MHKLTMGAQQDLSIIEANYNVLTNIMHRLGKRVDCWIGCNTPDVITKLRYLGSKENQMKGYIGGRKLLSHGRKRNLPSGTQRRNDVGLTSMRRHNVTSTAVRRNYDAMCLMGTTT